MDISISKKHNGGYVTLLFKDVSVSGGAKRTRDYPGHGPTVDFRDAVVEDDELERDLDAIAVFEEHDTYFCDRLVEEYGEQYEARKSAYEADAYDRMKDEGRL